METVKHYDANYGQFSTEVYAAVRREAFGEDIGQNSWLTADEHDLFIGWMAPRQESRVLDVACGSGRTTLRVARKTGCAVHGIDMHAAAIAEARAAAEQEGLTARAQFEQGDAAKRLPFDDATFDALICIDAINHLPNRPAVLAEWARTLKPGGVLVFTDPIVITGALTAEEMTIRSSIGFFLFVPPGLDERMLDDTGFDGLPHLQADVLGGFDPALRRFVEPEIEARLLLPGAGFEEVLRDERLTAAGKPEQQRRRRRE